MLGVSPNTLRSWERRYGFPRPLRTPGGHRQYALAEIEELRLALGETRNVSSAVAVARERGAGPSSAARLANAFSAFDEDKANRLLEESLMVRSVERTVEEVLLGAVAAHDPATAEYEFAWRYATGWLSAAKRLAPPDTFPAGVLILDGTAACDPDALYAQALELLLRRAGLPTLSLTPSIETERLGRAMSVLQPGAVVLSGRGVSLDWIGRLVYAVHNVADGAVVFDFRGSVPHSDASTVLRLGEQPIAARDALVRTLAGPDPRTGPAETPQVRAV